VVVSPRRPHRRYSVAWYTSCVIRWGANLRVISTAICLLILCNWRPDSGQSFDNFDFVGPDGGMGGDVEVPNLETVAVGANFIFGDFRPLYWK